MVHGRKGQQASFLILGQGGEVLEGGIPLGRCSNQLLGFNGGVVFALAAIKAARIAALAGSVGFRVMEGLGMAAAAGCAFHDRGSIA